MLSAPSSPHWSCGEEDGGARKLPTLLRCLSVYLCGYIRNNILKVFNIPDLWEYSSGGRA